MAKTQAELNALFDKANELYGADEINVEVLSENDVSEGVCGTWVRAWVLIPKDE